MSDRITFAASIEAEGRRLKGSVNVAGSRTFRNNEWLEVDPAAIVKADASDVMATIDHDLQRIVGRTKNKTLSVNRTEQGIEFETAELPNTSYANDALELARGGYFGGSSFTIEGLRSTFTTDPDGTRVRRITSIKRLADVAIVMDPAFANSSATAFSKETDVTKETNPPEEPTPDPEPTPEPAKAKFTEQPKSGKDEWAAFARTLSTEQIEAGLDNLYSDTKGDLKGDALDRYEGFAAELQSRKLAETTSKNRMETLKFRHDAILGRIKKAPDGAAFAASDDYAKAFDQYARTNLSADEMRAQFAQTIAGDGTQGGFTVPDGFVNKITERLKAFGGIASIADEITTSTGESLRWPYIDDTANLAVIAAEDTQAASGADLVFDSIELGAFEYDATGAGGNPIEVSLPLLQDASFDLEEMLTRLLGRRIGRKQAVDFATGAGGTEPLGALSKAADVMSATVASLAAVEQVFQVDSAYREGGQCYWVMSDTSLAKVWGAQSTTNEPLFMPNRVINGKPFDTLMGYPIKVDPAAGNLVGFGDFEAGYIIRRVRGVQLLVDPYSAQKRRAVQYHAWARADGNIQDPNAYSVSDWSGVSADT